MENGDDLISRQAAIEALHMHLMYRMGTDSNKKRLDDWINSLPSAQPEPLTDKEQRIFLAAMGREEKVCKEVDRNFVLEPYEDSLVRTCHEITRKVKGALWTT